MPAGSAMNLSPVNMPSLLKPPSAALLKTHSANATSHRKAFRPLTDYFSNQSRTASSSAKKHTKRNVHVYSDDSDVSLRSSLDYASHEVETDEEEEHLDGQDEEEECVSLGVGVGGAVVGVGIVVNVVNKGEQHKENMLKSPPPPAAARQLFEEPPEFAQYHDER